MTSTSAAVLSESQPLDMRAATRSQFVLASYRSSWRRVDPLIPCVLTDYSETAAWRATALSKILNLRWLGTGWDGPDSEPISQVAIARACGIAQTVAEHLPSIVAPTILPTNYFGVLLEWHTASRSVAFTVDVDGLIEMDYRDKERDVEWEGNFEDHADSTWFTVLSDCR